MSKSFQQKKCEAREEAIEFQNTSADQSYSWGEIEDIQEHFAKLGKRNRLLRELRENGII